jgi:uncharacterized 2Fe-2S/4Fe-4S cluster protein (DUF4445 family)
MRVPVEPGDSLRDVLFARGVEFPCGGRGKCKACRVRVLEGSVPVTPEQAAILSPDELDAGWRLACRAKVEGRAVLEVAQWETTILADHSSFAFTPGEGYGVAVDIGTTTLVAQWLDLRTAHVHGVRTALNPQAVHGSDVMSRVQYALDPAGSLELTRLIRGEVGGMVESFHGPLNRITIVGNTVMHHLFCGIDVEPLAHCPFEPARDGLEVFRAAELGWKLKSDPRIEFLPCLGGFVGSDILGGILSTRMHESEDLIGLVDLGTNGEIIIGNRDRMVCASTAAGPAFEAGRISMGMRAAGGAISEVQVQDGRMVCSTLGHVPPRGICGSGLVDAAAAGLELGLIRPNGRLANGSLPLEPPVVLTQADIRELQLAKGATAAGIEIVLRYRGASPGHLKCLYLAGAFGNYVNRQSARRIGLIDFPLEMVEPAGNTALLGAKLALFSTPDYADIRRRTEHISLASDPDFELTYIESMGFPA